MVTVIGHDSSDGTSFGHAVVLTECVRKGTSIKFKLKNSLDGEHLEGSVNSWFSPSTLQLIKTRTVKPNIAWSMTDFDAWIIRFN